MGVALEVVWDVQVHALEDVSISAVRVVLDLVIPHVQEVVRLVHQCFNLCRIGNPTHLMNYY